MDFHAKKKYCNAELWHRPVAGRAPCKTTVARWLKILQNKSKRPGNFGGRTGPKFGRKGTGTHFQTIFVYLQYALSLQHRIKNDRMENSINGSQYRQNLRQHRGCARRYAPGQSLAQHLPDGRRELNSLV